MPFGLCTAPSSFQVTMNETFRSYLCKFVIVFFNNILIYSKTLEDHLPHLDQTFQVLEEGKFFLKMSKCSFAQQKNEYLGHLVLEQGVKPFNEKVLPIQQWQVPWSFKALRGFLGLTGFYCWFIKGYASIITPLTQLLMKPHLKWPLDTEHFPTIEGCREFNIGSMSTWFLFAFHIGD